MSIKSFDELWKKIQSDVVAKLDNHIEKLDQHIVQTEENFSRLDGEIENLQQQISHVTDEAVDAALAELSDRNKRGNNIILLNVPEQASETLDIKFITKLLNDHTQNLDLVNLKTVRLGKLDKNTSAPRPLKVTLNKSCDAQWLIYNSKNLEFGHDIILKSDKTPYQRAQVRRAVMELKARETKGEQGLSIRWIAGVPKVVTSVAATTATTTTMKKSSAAVTANKSSSRSKTTRNGSNSKK